MVILTDSQIICVLTVEASPNAPFIFHRAFPTFCLQSLTHACCTYSILNTGTYHFSQPVLGSIFAHFAKTFFDKVWSCGANLFLISQLFMTAWQKNFFPTYCLPSANRSCASQHPSKSRKTKSRFWKGSKLMFSPPTWLACTFTG